MEARLVEALPREGPWQFEPKWDGFRCIALCGRGEPELWSKAGKPLGRYFPDVVARLAAQVTEPCTLDGELIIPVGEALSFGALQARLHPAESRVRRLAQETPAEFMLFDCLAAGGHDLLHAPLGARRVALEALHRRIDPAGLPLSPYTLEGSAAERWLAASGGALDGVVAKRLDEPYRPGERAMLKVKQHRTADCVVGGFRFESGGRGVGSLLLGLYNEDGLLDHVGFTSGLEAGERVALAERLAPLIEAPGFTGRAPGGPSRWSNERSAAWQPLRPELVVEVVYDQVTDGRFRHGTRLHRWRPDKAPRQCTSDQLQRELRPAELAAIL